MKDQLAIRGQLRIVHLEADCLDDPQRSLPPDVVDRMVAEGRAKVSTVVDNLIVDGGLGAVSRLLGFGRSFPSVGGIGVTDINDLQIASMQLAGAAFPPTPAATDTGLSTTPLFTATALSVYYPDATSVVIAGVIPQANSALDGMPITEEGLFLANGAMIAKVVFPAEVKVPTNAIQFEHRIAVTRG